jgi:hypothetical protein
MRLAHVLIIAAVAALAFSTAASAHVRHGMKTAGMAAVEVVTGDDTVTSDDGSPSPSPSGSPTDVSPSPEPTETDEPAPEPESTVTIEDDGPQWANHGEAVSEVAKNKDAVGTKKLKNGKEVSNHGQAVSAVAKTDAGKPDKGFKHGGDSGDESDQE